MSLPIYCLQHYLPFPGLTVWGTGSFLGSSIAGGGLGSGLGGLSFIAGFFSIDFLSSPTVTCLLSGLQPYIIKWKTLNITLSEQFQNLIKKS